MEGVLRLAAKYDIPYLRLRATARLRHWYPDTIAGWRIRIEPWPRHSVSDYFNALDLVRTADVRICLPAILFCMCSFKPHEILAPGALDLATRILILESTAVLSKRLRTAVWRWLYEDIPGCATPLQCGRNRGTYALGIEEAEKFAKPAGIMFTLPSRLSGLCVMCGERAKMGMRAGQEKVWDELPAIFGLGGWDELRQGLERRFFLGWFNLRMNSTLILARQGWRDDLSTHLAVFDLYGAALLATWHLS